MTLTTSATGRLFIAAAEGTKLVAYRDGGGVLTIGTGHTSAAGAPKVTVGLRITGLEADVILTRDLAGTEAAVRAALGGHAVTQHQFDAFVSLAFNIGNAGFAGSSVARRFKAGDLDGAEAAFAMWCKDNGKVVPGLVKRRHAEAAMFRGDVAGAFGALGLTPPPKASTTTPAPAPSTSTPSKAAQPAHAQNAQLAHADETPGRNPPAPEVSPGPSVIVSDRPIPKGFWASLVAAFTRPRAG